MTDYSQQYFTIESLENGNVITLTIGSGVTSSDLAWIAWSKDKTNWTTTNNVDNQTVTITVNAGIENVYFKGSGTRLAVGTTLNDNNSQTVFSSTNTFNASGNIMSLLYSDNFAGQTTLIGTFTFDKLFYSSNVVDASNLVLPATTLSQNCYRAMFRACTSLVSAPNLQSINLVSSCYREMFYGCTSLVSMQDLPATTLASYCYNNMFYGCKSLTQIPNELPATTLYQFCYDSMFQGCTSIKKAPILPASTIPGHSYEEMFYGCSLLNEVTCLATSISNSNSITNWLRNTSASGTFYKHPSMTSWPSGASGIPSGWTTKDYMMLTINGKVPTAVKFVQNGVTHDLDYLKFGNNLVWQKTS